MVVGEFVEVAAWSRSVRKAFALSPASATALIRNAEATVATALAEAVPRMRVVLTDSACRQRMAMAM
jgi:hypothetical protein